MKVLHVLHTSAPYVAGYCTRSSEIIAQQQAMGMEVQVVTSAQHPNDKQVDQEVVDGLVHWRTRAAPQGRPPLLREWGLMASLQRRTNDAIAAFSPDLVHAHSPVLVGFPAKRAAKAHGLPFVYEIRDLWENALVDRDRFGRKSLFYQLARQFESYLVRQADQVVTISEQLRNEITGRAGHDRVTVVGNGVQLEDFQHLPCSKKLRAQLGLQSSTIFGYIGTFQPYEGLLDLVDAFDSLVKHKKGISLVIVGGGGIEQELEAHVKSKLSADRITLTGKVPRHDVHLYYDLIDVFVYPRHDTATTRLTTPLKPLEAMAARKPVIASRLPAMMELVRDDETGVTCEPNNTASLAACMQAVSSATADNEALVNKAYAWVEQNRTWSTVCLQYQQIYASAQAKG